MLTPLRSKIGDLLAAVYALRAKPGGNATTLSAGAAAGATALTLTATTGFGDDDPIWVGSEEDKELVVQSGAPSGSTVNLDAPGLKRAHVATEPVTELEAYDLGNCVNVQVATTADVADNETDVSRNPDGRRLGHVMPAAQFDLQGYSPWHFALLAGMALARVRGAGTLTDPTQLHTDGDDFGTDETGIVFVSRKKDGTFLRHEFDACSADYTSLMIPMGQGREAALAGRFMAANHWRAAEAAAGFLVNTAQQIRKGAQLEALLEAGWFRPLSGGLSTTLTGATAKDARVFNLAAATGFAAGKYYLVTGGGRSQIIIAQSLATLALTARTEAYYTFPTGSTVVELELVPFAGLAEGTTEFRVGGAVRPVRFDNARVAAGHQAGSALFTFATAPTDLTVERLRQQLGLPSAAVAGGVLTTSDLMGTDAPVGWYARALRKDAKTVLLIGTELDNGLETLTQALSKAQLPNTPLTFRNRLLSQLMW